MSAPADFMCRLLRDAIDIEAVWSVGHNADPDVQQADSSELLIFADPATLVRLRKCDSLREDDVSLLVVTDGDSFENAWGAQPSSGSLARWAWREGTAGQAYYDESRWAPEDEAGSVVRVRRKAYLVWSRTNSVPGT